MHIKCTLNICSLWKKKLSEKFSKQNSENVEIHFNILLLKRTWKSDQLAVSKGLNALTGLISIGEDLSFLVCFTWAF